MKNLLIITSIILLSYQIDRLLTNDNSKLPDTKKVTLANAFIATDSAASPVASLRSAMPISKDIAVSVKKVADLDKAGKTITAKTKLHVNRLKGFNKNFSTFHRNIKQSGNYLQFSSVQFKRNEHESVGTEQFNTVLQFADKLIFNESLKVSIAGFADNKGNEIYNENLSLQRAENIKEYLIELGVREDQIMISANGTADPVGDNASEEGRAENRRVEMALVEL